MLPAGSAARMRPPCYGAWRWRAGGFGCACGLCVHMLSLRRRERASDADARASGRLTLTRVRAVLCAGAIPVAATPGARGRARRKPTTLGLVLYAAVLVVGTVALIGVLVTVGADGGRLKAIVGLQAPSSQRGRHARGPQHLRLKAAASGKAMSRVARSQKLDEEGGEEECICDDPNRCYVCFVRHSGHGHGHHDEEHHEEEHHEEKVPRAQQLAEAGTVLDEHEEHGEHGGHGHGHHSMYEEGHVYHTSIRYFQIIPDCCEHPERHEVHDPDSSYNQPCVTEEEELEPFAVLGTPKVCDAHDMQVCWFVSLRLSLRLVSSLVSFSWSEVWFVPA